MALRTNESALPKMDDVFTNQPHPEILKDHLVSSRLRAIDILQNVLPIKITRLRTLIEQENEPSSIWSKDQVFSATYAKIEMPQPSRVTHEDHDGGIEIGGQGVVMPSDIIVDGAATTSLLLHEDELDGKTQVGEKEGENKVRLGMHWFEVLKLNEVQIACGKVVSAEVEELHILVQDLRVWLELEVPLIEDGNSFGAEVQALISRELLEIYKKCAAMSNGVRGHHGDRLKLAMDWAKFPNMQDFAAAISASDKYDHLLLRSYLRTLLTIYGGLLTKFQRNWKKVINPKGTRHGGEGMY